MNLINTSIVYAIPLPVKLTLNLLNQDFYFRPTLSGDELIYLFFLSIPLHLWFNSSEDLEISRKPVALLADGVDVELV